MYRYPELFDLPRCLLCPGVLVSKAPADYVVSDDQVPSVDGDAGIPGLRYAPASEVKQITAADVNHAVYVVEPNVDSCCPHMVRTLMRAGMCTYSYMRPRLGTQLFLSPAFMPSCA